MYSADNSISEYGIIPSIKQAAQFKALSKEEKLDENKINEIMSEKPKAPVKISFTVSNLKRYFPEEYTVKQMEDVIYKLLEDWSKMNK